MVRVVSLGRRLPENKHFRQMSSGFLKRLQFCLHIVRPFWAILFWSEIVFTMGNKSVGESLELHEISSNNGLNYFITNLLQHIIQSAYKKFLCNFYVFIVGFSRRNVSSIRTSLK